MIDKPNINMKIKGLLSAFAILSLSSLTWAHPLKMSFSKLAISSDGDVELQTSIFLDDLTDHMQKVYNIQQPDFSAITSYGIQVLQHYFQNTFYFEQDGKKLILQINDVSFSRNGLGLVVKMSTTKQLDVSKEVSLVNTLLCDSYAKQRNNITYLDKFYELSMKNPKVKIQIK